MAATGMFGAGEGGLINPPDPNRQYSLSMVEIVVLNKKCFEVLQDLTVIIDLAKVLYKCNTIIHIFLLFIRCFKFE